MSNSLSLLEPWVKPGMLNARHVSGAKVLMDLAFREKSSTRDVNEWLIVALLLKTPEDEHTCLNLAEMDAYEPKSEEDNEWAPLPFVDLASWRKVVLGMPELVAIVDGKQPIERPIVLAGDRLYLARMYGDEVYVADTLKALNDAGRLKVLFGGPGSGKTTKTAEDLVELLGDKPQGFKVELAAPTGKAAKRMSQVIQERVEGMKGGMISDAAIANAVQILKPVKSKTIHKLLKFNPVADSRYRMNESNPLDCDLLVVDESSMLSLDMLVHVLSRFHSAPSCGWSETQTSSQVSVRAPSSLIFDRWRQWQNSSMSNFLATIERRTPLLSNSSSLCKLCRRNASRTRKQFSLESMSSLMCSRRIFKAQFSSGSRSMTQTPRTR